MIIITITESVNTTFIENFGLVQYKRNVPRRFKDTYICCEIDHCSNTTQLVLDHCKDHGWVRGVICHGCNMNMVLLDKHIVTNILSAKQIISYTKHKNNCPDCVKGTPKNYTDTPHMGGYGDRIPIEDYFKVISNECLYCKAKSGQHCKSKNGKQGYTHKIRIKPPKKEKCSQLVSVDYDTCDKKDYLCDCGNCSEHCGRSRQTITCEHCGRRRLQADCGEDRCLECVMEDAANYEEEDMYGGDSYYAHAMRKND